MNLRFTEQARADLFAQLDWLVDRTPPAARRAARQIATRLALIAEFPQAAPAVEGGYRDAPVRFGRDGFVVRYRVEDDTVTIVRIFHGRQTRG